MAACIDSYQLIFHIYTKTAIIITLNLVEPWLSWSLPYTFSSPSLTQAPLTVCSGQWSSRVCPRSSPAIVTTSYYYIIKSLSSSLVSTTSSILTSAYTIFGDGACFLISGFLKIFAVIQVVKTLSNIVLYIDVKIAGLHKKLWGARWVELVQDNLPLLCLPLSIVCFFATQLLERRMESNAAMHNIWKLDSNCD